MKIFRRGSKHTKQNSVANPASQSVIVNDGNRDFLSDSETVAQGGELSYADLAKKNKHLTE